LRLNNLRLPERVSRKLQSSVDPVSRTFLAAGFAHLEVQGLEIPKSGRDRVRAQIASRRQELDAIDRATAREEPFEREQADRRLE
jgi:regulator of protease activity HflC (stomatin/prohibitin superfamily)